MDVGAYLKRIDHHAPAPPTLATLRALQRAQLLTVPFENLDIHLGRQIRLDQASLFDKIVTRRRGGFCFELNGLFAELLRELGFRVTLLNSRIPETHNGWQGRFDHPILLVELAEPWIVDIGFGDAYRTPLRLDQAGDQQGLHSLYRLEPDGRGSWRFLEFEKGAWEFYYEFSLEPANLTDFREACVHYESSPNSSFTQKTLCTRATGDGHITLSQDRLTIFRGEEKEQKRLLDQTEIASALRQHFNITLDGELRMPPGAAPWQ